MSKRFVTVVSVFAVFHITNVFYFQDGVLQAIGTPIVKDKIRKQKIVSNEDKEKKKKDQFGANQREKKNCKQISW